MIVQSAAGRHPSTETSLTLHADREMLGAAVLFTAATLSGSIVAIRRDLAAEPFGISLALPVPAAAALGWGTALSAPWPMPAAALFAVRHARRSTGPGPGLVHIGLGTGALIGGLGEPVLRSVHRQTNTVRAAIGVNPLAASVLIAAGLRQVCRDLRSHEPPRGGDTADPGRDRVTLPPADNRPVRGSVDRYPHVIRPLIKAA